MGLTATITDTTTDFSAQLTSALAGLTNVPPQAGKITVGPGTFTAAYSVHMPGYVQVEGAGETLTVVKPSSICYAPIVWGVPSTVGGGLQAGHRTTITYNGGTANTWRTLGTAVGVFNDTPFRVGPKPSGGNFGGWGVLDELTINFYFKLESGSWTPDNGGGAGLFGITDSQRLGSVSGAVAEPYYVVVEKVAGVPSLVLYLMDSLNVQRRFYFPLEATPPAYLHGAFYWKRADGTVLGWKNSAAAVTSRIQQTVTALDGAWPTGNYLAHNFVGCFTLGSVGPNGATFGERYLPADLTFGGLWMAGVARWQDRGAGQPMREIGDTQDVQDKGIPDDFEYKRDGYNGNVGLLGYMEVRYDLSPNAAHLPCMLGGGLGNKSFGYFLRSAWSPADTVTGNRLDRMTVYGSADPANPYGTACLYGSLYDFVCDRFEFSYGAFGYAKLGGAQPTSYINQLSNGLVSQTAAAGFNLGFGITRISNVNVKYWGRCALVLAQNTLDYDQSFCTDSTTALNVCRTYGASSSMRLRSIIFDFEGGGPLYGHYYFHSGSSVFPPAVEMDGCSGGSALSGVPFVTLDGPLVGGLTGFITLKQWSSIPVFTGDGDIILVVGGIWQFYVLPPGQTGPPGPPGTQSIPWLG